MFAIYRLCEHPKYIRPLTDEVENMLNLPETNHYRNLPLMESFLREAAQYDPLDSCRPIKASEVESERFHLIAAQCRSNERCCEISHSQMEVMCQQAM
jgi:hypothetical protein